MKITIKEIICKNDLKKFIKFPNKLYEKNNFYVPPLISAEPETLSEDKNPASDFSEAKYWLAYRENNTIVGRIAGIINHKYNKKVGKQLVRFGWLRRAKGSSQLAARKSQFENEIDAVISLKTDNADRILCELQKFGMETLIY